MKYKDWIAQQLMQHEGLHKSVSLLDQYKHGLQKADMLSIIQAFPENFLPLFTYEGEIKAKDVLEILHIEEDKLQDTLTLELLTMYINQLCQAGIYLTLRVTRASIQKIASIKYTITYCHLFNPRVTVVVWCKIG